MGVNCVPCNVYDLEEGYSAHLIKHFDNPADGLHLGKHEGDVTQVMLQDLKMPVDLLSSGPPCPPWAGNGNKQGTDDAWAQVFVAVVKWMVHFMDSSSQPSSKTCLG